MSFPAIQFARHIAQFHIQFYGRTTTTPIYFTAAIPLSLPLLLLLLLVGRSLVHPFHRPSTFLPSTPPYLILFYFIFFFLQNNSISLVDYGRYEERDLTKDGFHGNYPWEDDGTPSR